MSYRAPFIAALVCLIGFTTAASARSSNEILNIRHWVAPDHTRVVIDTSREAAFTVERGEATIAVDLDSTAWPSELPRRSLLEQPGLTAITLSSRPGPGVRVEIELSGPLQTHVFRLKRFQDKPDRIVIDIALPDAARRERDARQQVKTARKSRIVVIDPGHGGEAPGAVGRRGTLEKDVVLGMARRIRDILNRTDGYRAFLTREDDYYVSFRRRLLTAREYGADLFISVHADAARNREARGSSVYCLSTGAASSEAARILARSENLADAIGGAPDGEVNDASDPIVLDMVQNHTINQSKALGAVLLRELGTVNRLKFATVQEAPFMVLKLPEIPSVLVETAYISNDKDEKLLKNSRFQERIAEGIARAVVGFLPPIAEASAGTADAQRADAAVRNRVKAAPREQSVPAAVAPGGADPPGAGGPLRERNAGTSAAAAKETEGGKRAEPERAANAAAPGGRGEEAQAPPVTAKEGGKRAEPARAANAAAPGGRGEEAEAPPVTAKEGGKRAEPERAAPPARAANVAAPGGKGEKERAASVAARKGSGAGRDAPSRAKRPAARRGDTDAKREDPLQKATREKGERTGKKPESGRKSNPDPVRKKNEPLKPPRPNGTPESKRAAATAKRSAAPKAEPTLSYRVRPGDTLGTIAASHGTSVRVLIELNSLKRPDHLPAGRKLLLPETPARPKKR